MKFLNNKNIIIFGLLSLPIEPSSEGYVSPYAIKELQENNSKHIDPFQGCTFQSTKAPKTIVKKECIGGKIVKITYSDGTIQTIG